MQAAKALLEDKLLLMNMSAGAPRVDIHRIRADVEREMAAKLEADMQARLRTLGESIRMESLQTIRSRDVQIAELKEQVHKFDTMLLQQKQVSSDTQERHERQMMERLRVRDTEVESLEHIKEKLMSDRAVVEQVVRSERKQREEEFNDMDANVRARDERIQELSELLEAQQGCRRVANASMLNEQQRRL